MPDRTIAVPRREESGTTQEVCIHSRKIYDSCRGKDCCEDLRIYPTVASAALLQNSATARAREARLLWVSSNVEELSFNRGYYTVDLTYYYKVLFDGCLLPATDGRAEGLAIFNKRVILFGSEGGVKVFASDAAEDDVYESIQPIAVVEAVDPIVLRTRLIDSNQLPTDALPCNIPGAVLGAFSSGVDFDSASPVLVTLGQFSIVRLERDAQLSIPSYDYCVPEGDGILAEEEDPCTLFNRINFPTDEFFPPAIITDARFRPAGEENG